MKPIVTVSNPSEAILVSEKDIGILDIKNPSEGSLGCPNIENVKEITDKVPEKTKISIALGDMPHLPNTVSMAIKGALDLNPDYVKIGLKGSKNMGEVEDMFEKAVKPVKRSGKDLDLVAAVYADQDEKFLDPVEVAKIASKFGLDGVMIDTLNKDGSNILDEMNVQNIKEFSELCESLGLQTAIAGSIKKSDLSEVMGLTDYVGVRGALCDEERDGNISEKKTDQFLEKF